MVIGCFFWWSFFWLVIIADTWRNYFLQKEVDAIMFSSASSPQEEVHSDLPTDYLMWADL